jgi:hypothetical protein
MHADHPLHDLGIWPSPAEILQGVYPEWRIWRDIDESGRHGDWIAEHATERDRVCRAADIARLRMLIDKDTARRRTTRRADPVPRRHHAGRRPRS